MTAEELANKPHIFSAGLMSRFILKVTISKMHNAAEPNITAGGIVYQTGL